MKSLLVLFVSAAFAAVGFSQVVPPTLALVGNPSIAQMYLSDNRLAITATFNIQITATSTKGPDGRAYDYTFGSKSFEFSVYKDGLKLDSPNGSFGSAFSIPSAGVVFINPNGEFDQFKLTGNNTIVLPVTVFLNELSTSSGLNGQGVYSFGLDSVKFNFIDGSTPPVLSHVDSMASSLEWRTAGVSVVSLYEGGGGAIPEPFACTAIAGVCMLGLVFYRNRHKSVS